MTDGAAIAFNWKPFAGAAALLLAPFATLSGLLWLAGPRLDEIVWVWLGLALAAGASGLLLLGLSNWIRALLALAYAATLIMPLFMYAVAFVCVVYRLCP